MSSRRRLRRPVLGRAGRGVDEGATRRLPVRKEDRIVPRAPPPVRPLSKREPLTVDNRVPNTGLVRCPVVAVVLADTAQLSSARPSRSTKYAAPLVVDDHVGVTAAGRRVRPEAGEADDVELLAAVGRPVTTIGRC